MFTVTTCARDRLKTSRHSYNSDVVGKASRSPKSRRLPCGIGEKMRISHCGAGEKSRRLQSETVGEIATSALGSRPPSRTVRSAKNVLMGDSPSRGASPTTLAPSAPPVQTPPHQGAQQGALPRSPYPRSTGTHPLPPALRIPSPGLASFSVETGRKLK